VCHSGVDFSAIGVDGCPKAGDFGCPGAWDLGLHLVSPMSSGGILGV
jgi:hypothetical protein